jgi:outer membrane protein TolC
MVVLTVMDLYFRAVSAGSRVSAVEAQVASAEALNTRAVDLKSAGVVPGIDVLRSQVELQTMQQRLIQARNDFSREKLNLARAIGLPLAQEFTLANSLPAAQLQRTSIPELVESAYANRPELKAAEARLRAAGEAVKAAKAENFPPFVSMPTMELSDRGRTIRMGPIRLPARCSFRSSIRSRRMT